MDISVKREKIVITDIDAKELDVNTYYIQIKSFWEHVSSDFKKVIEPLSQKNNITKIIIDLRNNWGWYLTEVTEMLSYFVPKWENTAVVKYHTNNKEYVSKWYDYVDFNNYKIVILENSWTASASEILIWTLSDYFEDIEIIWEQSYWKWSVQVMKNYADWSLLKYTIAKWFTGWTETWIDWIGITPTYQLDFDYDKYKNYWIDNQLEKAKNIR
jgi:carboxyl-terminal processing protease